MKIQLPTVVPAFFRARLFVCGLTCVLILAGDGWAASHSVVKEASYSGEYGLQLDFDTTASSYLQDESPVSEPHYRARFYINVNGYVNLWLDGEPQEGITGLFYQGAVIDFVRWGVVTGNPATISGYLDLDDFASDRFDYIGVNVRAAGCSGDEVTLDISKFPLPEDIPVLCQASRSFKTTDKQSVVVAKGMNLRIESPRTTLYSGLQVQVGGIFSVDR